MNQPYIIVLGNEKGGTGKSTLSIHIITQLLQLGYKVGSIDIDARQGTLSRYLENRETSRRKYSYDLKMPDHHPIYMANEELVKQAQQIERQNFIEVMDKLRDNDFIVIDTPGHDAFLSKFAHSYAHTVITPINDSFIDLDVLVKTDQEDRRKMRPSLYAETMWEQKKQRLIRDRFEIDWIVVRNRLSHIQAKNKIEMSSALDLLASRIGFRIAPGFSERVIFRELFLKGMTLIDLEVIGTPLSMSHVAAKQELRTLLETINLPDLRSKIEEQNNSRGKHNVNKIIQQKHQKIAG